MAKSQNEETSLWDGITDEDFINEDNIEDVEMVIFNTDRMRIFFANTTYFRQLIRLSDSLKPVSRRLLYTMKKLKAVDGRTFKSQKIVGDTSVLHPHSGDAIYGNEVTLGQYWRTPVPLISGTGNFGNAMDSKGHGQMRYTEACISKYAKECFFEEYDEDCIEMLMNEGAGEEEPVSFPSKFPNVFVNGGFGIGTAGNKSCIPSYNIDDIVELIRRLMTNPDDPDIYMVPDFPTGADIVDDGSLRSINDTGKGNIKMRSTIDVIEGFCQQDKRKIPAWELHILNLPWMVDIPSVQDKIVEYAKAKKLPLLDVQDHSKQLGRGTKVRTIMDYVVYVNKDHDPYRVREMLWKYCLLQKTISIDFKVVMEDHTIGEMNVRDLALDWLAERRLFKRRIYNKKLARLAARNDLLEILLEISSKEKYDRTTQIIRESKSADALKQLMKLAKMNSHQATAILQMRLIQFAEDARASYKEELKANKLKEKEYLGYVQSEKKIDDVIWDEIRELRKYATPRRTHVVKDNGRVILNTEHIVVVTKNGYVKKFNYVEGKTPPIGAMKQGDMPNRMLKINNMDQILFFDSLGRVSSIPVNDIPTTDTSQYGTLVFDLTKLNGEIISVLPYFSRDSERFVHRKLNDEVHLITLSADGYFKKMSLDAYREIKNFKNARACKMRDGDKIVYANYMLDSSSALVYTKNGYCCNVDSANIPVSSKDSQGLLACKLDATDMCIGIAFADIFDYLFVLTDKGCAKKIETKYMVSGGKRKEQMIPIVHLDQGDFLNTVMGFQEKVRVITRTGVYQYDAEEIGTLGTRAKCKKLVPIPQGSNIILVEGF